MIKLGSYYEDQDFKSAEKYYLMAAEKNNDYAIFYLDHFYEKLSMTMKWLKNIILLSKKF